MPLPSYRVQWLPGSSAFDVPGTWQTLPETDVMTLTWSTGRDNELDQFRSGSCTIVLRNNDRRYDPEHTTGPNYGFLLPRVPFRVQLSTDGLSWFDEFYGFVQSGWEQGYAKPYASTCTIVLEDLLGVLESVDLPDSAWAAQVLDSDPVAFWRLDERAGTQMSDSSGNGNHGLFDNGTLGEDSLVTGDGSSFEAPHEGDNRGRYKGGSLPVSAPCTVVAWIKTPRDLTLLKAIVVAQRDYSVLSGLFIDIEQSGFGSPNGELVVQFLNLGGGYKVRGSTRLDNNMPHMVTVTIAGTAAADVLLYVDGALETKTLVSGTTAAAWTSHLTWTVGNTVDSAGGDFGLDGLIDEVAVFDSVLSGADVADLYDAGTAAFDGDGSGERVDRVLDLIGVPSALRDIATGDTTMGPADYGAQSAASYLQRVVESEQGLLYVDHRNGGKLTFRGRYERLTATRSTTAQAAFDSCDFREDIAPEPNGIGTVVNVADIEWRGGEETVVDELSKQLYGAQSRSLTTEAPTAQAARSAGAWLVARYKAPQTRLRRLPFDMAGKPDLWSTVLGLRISDRVTVTRHPQGVGSPIVNSLIIEGTEFSLADEAWIVDMHLSDADDSEAWIWGVSEWGEDTVWG